MPLSDARSRVGYAAVARARHVPAEYKHAAHRFDGIYNGTTQNAVGPLEQGLEDFGGIKPLVVVQFGD